MLLQSAKEAHEVTNMFVSFASIAPMLISTSCSVVISKLVLDDDVNYQSVLVYNILQDRNQADKQEQLLQLLWSGNCHLHEALQVHRALHHAKECLTPCI